MKSVGRIDKDRYYLEIAKTVALRSPCIRAKYGAIIVKNDAVVSTGYNGPVRGGVNCYEIGECIKDVLNLPHGKAYDLCPAVHAEENCIINAARIGASVLGGVLYLCGIDPKTNRIIYSEPCDRCKRAIINAGIVRVVTVDADGSMIEFNVEEWVKRDTENYLKTYNLAKEGKLKI